MTAPTPGSSARWQGELFRTFLSRTGEEGEWLPMGEIRLPVFDPSAAALGLAVTRGAFSAEGVTGTAQFSGFSFSTAT